MENRGFFNRLTSFFRPNPQPSPTGISNVKIHETSFNKEDDVVTRALKVKPKEKEIFLKKTHPVTLDRPFQQSPAIPTSGCSIKEQMRLNQILKESKKVYKQKFSLPMQSDVLSSKEYLKALRSSACPRDRAKAVELAELSKQIESESKMPFDRNRVVPQVYLNGRLSYANECSSKWTPQPKPKQPSVFSTSSSSSSSSLSLSSSLSSSSSSQRSFVLSNIVFQTNDSQSKSNGCDSQATSRTKTLTKPAGSTSNENKKENEDKGKGKEKDENKIEKKEKNGNEKQNKNEQGSNNEDKNKKTNHNVWEDASSSNEENNKGEVPRRYTYAEKGKAIAVYPPPSPPKVHLQEVAKTRIGIIIGKDRAPIQQSQPSSVEDKPSSKVRENSSKNVSRGSEKEVSCKADNPKPVTVDQETFKRIVRDFALAFQVTGNGTNASPPSNQTTVVIPPNRNQKQNQKQKLNQNQIQSQSHSSASSSSLSFPRRVASSSNDGSYKKDDPSSSKQDKTSASNANPSTATPAALPNQLSPASNPKPVSQAAGKTRRWKVVPHPSLKKSSPAHLSSPTSIKRPVDQPSLPSPEAESNAAVKRSKPYAPPLSSPPPPSPSLSFSSLSSQNNSPVKRPVRIKTPIDWAAFSAKWSESFHKMNLAKSNLDAQKSTLTQAQQAVVDSICAQTGLGLDQLDRAAVCSYVNEMTKTVLQSTDAAHADWVVAETEAVAYFKMLYKKKLLGYYSQRRWGKYAEHKKGFTQYLPQVCEGNEEEEQGGEGSEQ